MKLENMKKSELINLLTEIQGQVKFLERLVAVNKKDIENGSSFASSEWSQGRYEAFSQAAGWLNEKFSVYTESTRP